MFLTKQARVKTASNCAFCGKRREDVVVLIEHGPNVRICNECVALCADMVREDRYRKASVSQALVGGPRSAPRPGRAGNPAIPTCASCGKAYDEVQKLIAGPDVNICDECVEKYEAVLQEAVQRGDLGESQLEVYYTSCRVVLEIQITFNAEIFSDHLHTRSILRGFEDHVFKLGPDVGGYNVGLYTEEVPGTSANVRFVVMVYSLTPKGLRSLQETLNANIQTLPQPLRDAFAALPVIRVLTETPYKYQRN